MLPTRNKSMSIHRRTDRLKPMILSEKAKETNLNSEPMWSNLNHQKIKVDEVELGPKNIQYNNLSRLGIKCEISIKNGYSG